MSQAVQAKTTEDIAVIATLLFLRQFPATLLQDEAAETLRPLQKVAFNGRLFITEDGKVAMTFDGGLDGFGGVDGLRRALRSHPIPDAFMAGRRNVSSWLHEARNAHKKERGE